MFFVLVFIGLGVFYWDLDVCGVILGLICDIGISEIVVVGF